MRMPPDQLLGDRLHHVAEIERALLLRHAGMEHDLQQQVAEFVLQIVEIAARDRIGDLVGFLDRVWRDGREILLQVPRAAGLGRAQRRHDLDQTLDIAGGFHGVDLASRGAGITSGFDRHPQLAGPVNLIRIRHIMEYIWIGLQLGLKQASELSSRGHDLSSS